MHPKEISINEYRYALPESAIALEAVEPRDSSKLLIYKNNSIKVQQFRDIQFLLNEESLLVFNTSKVIHARILFATPNGQNIELFCLEALSPADPQQNLQCKGSCEWLAYIGNNRKWKSGKCTIEITKGNSTIPIHIERVERTGEAFRIRFNWDDDICFSEILERVGHIPIPPYIKKLREDNVNDHTRYQTVYAQLEGSVAAPTAGLHFTNELIESLKNKGVETLEINLHVGAGTFKPVQAEQLSQHEMHAEQIIIHRTQVESLLSALQNQKQIVAVGTTSMRSLESLFQFGCYCFDHPDYQYAFDISQWQAYEIKNKVSSTDAMKALLKYLDFHGIDYLKGKSQILIAPGYSYGICDALITNFHQPGSTLLLLVAAFIGDDWKKIYEYALANDFRFLSYGDSSILFREQFKI